MSEKDTLEHVILSNLAKVLRDRSRTGTAVPEMQVGEDLAYVAIMPYNTWNYKATLVDQEVASDFEEVSDELKSQVRIIEFNMEGDWEKIKSTLTLVENTLTYLSESKGVSDEGRLKQYIMPPATEPTHMHSLYMRLLKSSRKADIDSIEDIFDLPMLITLPKQGEFVMQILPVFDGEPSNQPPILDLDWEMIDEPVLHSVMFAFNVQDQETLLQATQELLEMPSIDFLRFKSRQDGGRNQGTYFSP